MSAAAGPATGPVRVLVVDDDVVARHVVRRVLDGASDVEVVGTASDGVLALRRLEQDLPDVVTLDVEMPRMDGLATLRELRRRWPDLPVVMFSTLTERGAATTLEALASGADDFATKPAGAASAAEAAAMVADTLLPRVRLWGARGRRGRAGGGATPAPASRVAPPPSAAPRVVPPAVASPIAPSPIAPSRTSPVVHLPAAAGQSPPARPARPGRAPLEAVVIGTSTGGPNALAEVVPALPASLPVPVLVVVHMPATFTQMLARRLDAASALHVVQAERGSVARPGTVLLAPGGLHLVPVRRGVDVVCELSEAPPENSCRPAVDVTLRAAVKVWGAGVLSVVLTGMGADGLEGTRAVVRAGGRAVVQDEATSVVWGMPGFVAREGLADRVVPLDDVARCVVGSTRPALTRAAR